MNLLRHAVSKQKRRFIDKDTGMDLDLAYITPNLIAMGYPSKSLESFYRNPMSEVEKFLDSRHEGTYKVYNLCSEKTYSDQRFHGRVAQFPFPDHSPPPFQLIHPFCEDVSDWLHTDIGNVVAIHCKAGKGRTGVMICSFLVHCGATAEEAIRLYGEKRTLDGLGVTIPSQLRYIRYYEQFLESRTLNYDPRLLTLQEIVINTIPKPLLGLEPGRNYLILTIMSGNVKIYESLPQHSRLDHKLQQIRISITDKIVLAGDVKIMLWYDSLYKRSHLCHFFFNTTFIDSEDSLFMKKCEIDKACKDKLHSVFDKNLSIQVNFSPALAQQSPLPTLDSLPNRAILLKYKNHEGPNSVQISPAYFTTRKLNPRNNTTNALTIFGTENDETPTGDEPRNKNSPPSSSSSPPTSGTSGTAATALLNAKLRSGGSKPFKPVWAEKDRDRDDNWDASSVNSDCSESDASLEWWYTKPPRAAIPATVVSGIHTHTNGGSAADGGNQGITISPPLSIVTVNSSSSIVPVTNFISSGPGGVYQQPIHSKPSVHGILSSPLSSHSSNNKSPIHSGSSPLAREIRFDTISKASGPIACEKPNSAMSRAPLWGESDGPSREKPASEEGLSSRDGSFVLEHHPNENDEGRDSGIESLHSKDRDQEEHDREKGWVDSISRWLWTADGKMEMRPSKVQEN
ncbi:hypothetical protein BGZ52_000545 [Haplosporangium bisporale]|nr:hypothetical protein BGZ52_000545 [Haplosporangium bisporale]